MGADAGAAFGEVTVVKQQNVGPYATAQLSSLTRTHSSTWLTQSRYSIPSTVTPISIST